MLEFSGVDGEDLNFTNYIVVSTEKTELISLLLLATTTLLD
jgi:hypothetical protein